MTIPKLSSKQEKEITTIAEKVVEIILKEDKQMVFIALTRISEVIAYEELKRGYATDEQIEEYRRFSKEYALVTMMAIKRMGF